MSLVTDYPLRDITEREIHDTIPRQYRRAFVKLDNPTQCFLLANPDRCGEVAELAYADRRVRIIGIIKTARAENCTWSKVRAMVNTIVGVELSESTLQRWAKAGDEEE